MVNNNTKKEELIVFSQNLLGGVQSFNYNLLLGDTENYFDKYTILIDAKESNRTKRFMKWDVSRHNVFSYSNREIVYNYSKRLSSLISNRDGLIITAFQTEIRTLDIFRKPNKTVFYIAHDNDYLSYSYKSKYIIDVFIAHNNAIYDELVENMPERKEDIFFLPYGIKLSKQRRLINYAKPLKILFLARFDIKKGIDDLFEIDRILKETNVLVEWTLIGDGPEKDRVNIKIAERNNFVSYRVDDNNELFNHICQHDIFILPSRLDGVPVALLETMSCGLVPIISEFNKGIIKVVPNDVGYVLPVGSDLGFAATISELNSNRHLLEVMSISAIRHAQTNYDIQKTSVAYYELFKNHRQHRKVKPKSPYKYRNILDLIGIPMSFRWAVIEKLLPIKRFIKAKK